MKRIFRKVGKIVAFASIVLLILVAILLAIVLNSENAIIQRVLKEVSSTINAPLHVENLTIRYFRNFPDLTVELSGLTLGKSTIDTATYCFADSTQGLIKLDKFYVAVAIKPLLDNRIKINKIEIDGFTANYCIDSLGRSNFDFLMASDSIPTEADKVDTTPAKDLWVLVSNLSLNRININFADQSLRIVAKVFIPAMNINAQIHNDSIQSVVEGSFLLSNIMYEDYNLQSINSIKGNVNVAYNNGKTEISDFSLMIDEMMLSAKGSVELSDTMRLNLSLSLKNALFNSLLSYLPSEMTNDLGIKSLSGSMNMEATIDGNYFDTLLLPSVGGSFSVSDVALSMMEMPEIKNFSISGDFSIANPNDLSTFATVIKQCDLRLPHSSLTFAGSVSNLDRISYRLKTSGTVNLVDLQTFIPKDVVQTLSGVFDFDISTWGILPVNPEQNLNYFLERTNLMFNVKNIHAQIDSVNEFRDLNFRLTYHQDKRLKIDGLSLKAPGYQLQIEPSSFETKFIGNFDNFEKLLIDLQRFSFNIPGLQLAGNASLKGLSKPEYSLTSKISLDFDKIKPLIPDSIFESISGKVETEIESFGTLNFDSIDATIIYKILFEQTKISSKVENLSFKLFDDSISQIDRLSLTLQMANDTLRVEKLTGEWYGVTIDIDSTQIWNIYKAYFLQQKDLPLIVQTDVSLGEFDYNRFAPMFETPEDTAQNLASNNTTTEQQNVEGKANESIENNPQSEGSTPEEYFPPLIVRGKFSMKQLLYEKMVLSNLQTLFRIDDSLYVVDNFVFNAFGGTIKTSAVYDTRNYPEQIITLKNEMENVNLHALLKENDDFYQTDFTHKNISGNITSYIDGRVVMIGDSLLYDKLMVKGRFKLENGGIYDYEPIKELGKFTNIRELENIVFKTFESGVFIYDNKIYFPKTDIVSTAADLSAFGMVSFGDDYQLHLKVHLGDALLGKSDKLLKAQGKESDLFTDEKSSERKGLYLLALNRNGESKYGFDNKRAQRIMTAEIKVQEQGLNLIFHPKLVNYSTALDRREVKKPVKQQ